MASLLSGGLKSDVAVEGTSKRAAQADGCEVVSCVTMHSQSMDEPRTGLAAKWNQVDGSCDETVFWFRSDANAPGRSLQERSNSRQSDSRALALAAGRNFPRPAGRSGLIAGGDLD